MTPVKKLTALLLLLGSVSCTPKPEEGPMGFHESDLVGDRSSSTLYKVTAVGDDWVELEQKGGSASGTRTRLEGSGLNGWSLQHCPHR